MHKPTRLTILIEYKRISIEHDYTAISPLFIIIEQNSTRNSIFSIASSTSRQRGTGNFKKTLTLLRKVEEKMHLSFVVLISVCVVLGHSFLQHQQAGVKATIRKSPIDQRALQSTLASIPSPETRVVNVGLFKGLLKDGTPIKYDISCFLVLIYIYLSFRNKKFKFARMAFASVINNCRCNRGFA